MKNEINLFNARGLSLMTQDFVNKRIEELEAENETLKGLLRDASARLRAKVDIENSGITIFH